jgi:hypothetical protein
MSRAICIAATAQTKSKRSVPRSCAHPLSAGHGILLTPNHSRDEDPFVLSALDQIETRLTWRPSRNLALHERFRKVGAGSLALKELQYLGHTQDGEIAERIPKLIDAILKPMETEWANRRSDGHPVARVKRLRAAILPDMIKGELLIRM